MQEIPHKRTAWVPVVLCVASLCLSVGIGTLGVASHMPFQADASGFRKLAGVLTGSAKPSWRMIHVLVAGCPCSRGVAEHLIARGPLKDIEEAVIFLGEDSALERRLKKSGLRVEPMSADEAADRYGLHGAPWLVLVDPGNHIRYAGGYSADRNARDGYHDIAIWQLVRTGALAKPFPAYGCAAGRRLQRKIDPFGFKYGVSS